MKAAICYETGKPLVVEDGVTVQSPGKGEVKVRVAVTAVCHSDLHFFSGEIPSPLPGLAGHETAGYVDEVGEVSVLRAEGDALILEIKTTPHLMRYIVEKGFVAVDGVSLTATQCRGSSFSVSLVAYTQEHTTLGKKRSGDLVNLEADVIAKYVERLTRRESGVTWDLLDRTGFVTVGK